MNEEMSVQSVPSSGYTANSNVMSNVAEAINKIKNALLENNQQQQDSYKSVTDPAFTARLEKAMQKNLDYVTRFVVLSYSVAA